MDGDTCGGLSPIAGIDKAFLRRWLAWHEAAVPALAAVNAQQPTAELRPADAGQTDEGDLMPYPLLDAIEGAAIRAKLVFLIEARPDKMPDNIALAPGLPVSVAPFADGGS
jgi:NAD+ synthase (glutamine-hydrolysing)